MGREFNIFGSCFPQKHYMVDTSEKIKKLFELINKGMYFVINRPRQYGKTTTLVRLEKILSDDYIVISINFQGMGEESFESSKNFCLSFMTLVRESLDSANISDEYKKAWFNEDITGFVELNLHIKKMCKNKKVILMIDEVDSASNNRVFLEFLGMLRNKYLARENKKDYTFHSVILASVYNIKNIKLKLIKEGYYTPHAEESKLINSPWNIAADFNVDMSFSPKDIESMLKEYQDETNIIMDTELISNEIYKYTSGYPFLVSYICKLIDEELSRNWSIEGVLRAVKIVLSRDNTLFDDLIKNLDTYKELYDYLYSMLIDGEYKDFNIDDSIIKLGSMFGYIKKEENDRAVIANKIFETRISNYFISKYLNIAPIKGRFSNKLSRDNIKSNSFDMELCLCKFKDHYREIYNEVDVPFLERHGRLLFLTYLKPLINGKGFYHIESQFTDDRRMDIVVDFYTEQFIIELKIWRGEKNKEKAYDQLLDYMNSKNASIGYLLIFDFRKRRKKEQMTEWVQIGDKKIFSILV